MKTHILSHLPPDHPWGQLVYWYKTVPSTNSQAKDMAAKGAPQGTVVLADSQSAGRGRLGRSFCSPAGSGIYMSVILRPSCPPEALMHLTCAVGCAVCDAVEEALGVRPGLKWINDLVVGGKKLGGILTELSIDPKTGLVDYAVVGIGINCNQSPEEFPADLRQIACSAAMVIGAAVDRAKLAAAMIGSLERMSRNLGSPAAIMAQYRRDCITIGREITVIRGEERRNGTALSILGDGSLLVQFDNGHTAAVNSGEVSVRGLMGYA